MKKNVILMIISILFCGALALGGTFLFNFEQKIENPSMSVPEDIDETEDDAIIDPILPSLGSYNWTVNATRTITFNMNGKTATNSPTTTGYFQNITWYSTSLAGDEGTGWYFSTTRQTTGTGKGSSPSNSYVTLPQASGYTFAGYYLNTAGTGTLCVNTSRVWLVDETVITGDKTLYAKWTASTTTYYKITLSASSATIKTSYNSTSATVTSTAYVYAKAGSTTLYYLSGSTYYAVTGLSTTRSGYTFGGYYTSSGGSGTQKITSTGYVLTSSWSGTSAVTYYAKMTGNYYKLTLSATGGTVSISYTDSDGLYMSAPSANSGTVYAKSGTTTLYYYTSSTYYAVSSLSASRTGHTYGGFYTSISYATQKIAPSSNVLSSSWTGTSATTYYAKFTANYYAVTLSVGSGGSSEVITVNYNGIFVSNSSTITIYALYNTTNLYYKESSTYYAITSISASRPGYFYTGFNLKVTGGTQYIVAGSCTWSTTFTMTLQPTLYANWRLPTEYRFTVDASDYIMEVYYEDGEEEASEIFEYTTIEFASHEESTDYYLVIGESLCRVNLIELKGYDYFYIYHTDIDNGGGMVIDDGGSSLEDPLEDLVSDPTADNLVFLVYDATPTLYSFKLDPNGAAIGVTYGSLASPGYSNYGTYTSVITFYCYFGDTTIYTVSSGDYYVRAFSGNRTGYKLASISDATTNGGLIVDIASGSGTLEDPWSDYSGSVPTFYAIWEANTYTISFVGNGNTGGSTASMTNVSYDAATQLRANGFTKTGYTFGGWKSNTAGGTYGTSASATTTNVTTSTVIPNQRYVKNLTSTDGGTVTLTAQWTANKYAITLNPNGGSVKISYNSTSTTATTSTVVIYAAYGAKTLYYKSGSTYYNVTAITTTRSGFTHNGYYTSASSTTQVIGQSTSATLLSNYATAGTSTYYAQWSADTAGLDVEVFIWDDETEEYTHDLADEMNWGHLEVSWEVPGENYSTGDGQDGSFNSYSPYYGFEVYVDMGYLADDFYFVGYNFTGAVPDPSETLETTFTFTMDAYERTVYVYLMHHDSSDSVKLQYDSYAQYFYVEDGYFPQSFVGEEANYILNNEATIQDSDADIVWTISGTDFDVYIYSVDALLAEHEVLQEYLTLGHTLVAAIYAPDYSYKFGTDKESGNDSGEITLSVYEPMLGGEMDLTFETGERYWFLVEPIRWRVSDYGVSEDSYPSDWKDYAAVQENVTVVSDKILWLSNFSDAAGNCEGWDVLVDSNLGKNTYYNLNLEGFMASDYESAGFSWHDYAQEGFFTIDNEHYNSVTSSEKIVKEEVEMQMETSLRVASVDEIDAHLSDFKAEVTDFVAVILGAKGNARYWTRNLGQYYGNGNSISLSGSSSNAFFDNVYGVRFAYNVSKVVRL